MRSERIKWAVLGCGGIARRRTIPEGIVPARNAAIVAVHDLNPQANAEVARQFEAQAAASVEELLRCDADAVYIATPPNVHCEQTLACARAGKHVLCEKPLGLTVAEAGAMMSACAQAGVRLGTAFMMRFHAQHQAALRLIRDGQLGQPVFARAQLSCWYPPLPGAWRQDPATGGGGSLMDMGGHCLDLLALNHLADRPTHHLSYGERKRVAIAGAYAMHPCVLALDEPTAGLDPQAVRETLAALARLHEDGTTPVLATHDVALALAWADTVAVVIDGQVRHGDPVEILDDAALVARARLERPWILAVAERLHRLGLVAVLDALGGASVA